MTAYAELVAASNFSFLRGASKPEELAATAAALGYKALAICDRNTVAGVVRAHKPAKKLGLQYIPGCRLVLQQDASACPANSAEKPSPMGRGLGEGIRPLDRAQPLTRRFAPPSPHGRGVLRLATCLDLAPTGSGPTAIKKLAIKPRDGLEIVCLPTDRDAWGRLCRLLTFGKRRAPKAECYLWLDDLIRHGEGQILILMPPTSGEPPQDFAEAAWDLAARFPGHVFIGAALAFDGQDARRLARLARLGQETGAPMVAAGDCLYHVPNRKPLQDVITCIREKCTIAEAGYRLQRNAERHLREPAEIARLYPGYQDAVARTAAIAKRCTFSLEDLSYDYPDEPYEPFASPQEALIHHTMNGLNDRYPEGPPQKVRDQVERELKLIEKLNYARYFLTVFDLVRYARKKEILCQGRGSAANSSVCYCLGITSVNPDKVDLLFERFISSERGEPPDIDVDFEHERREEVMQYVYEKYGRDRAGIVATVITYRAKSSIREVGKALGLSEEVISALSGMMWWWSSKGVEDSHIREAGLDPADRTLKLAVRLARELTGFPRHLSQHTGGFVMTRGLLEETVPIGNAAMDERTMIEWDKDDLDQLRLLKVDVLALGMLTCIRKSFDLIRGLSGTQHSLASVPQDDAKVYDMICEADTLGVFQIESRAQMSMLPRLRPRTYYDLVIEVAIVRPGPIQGDMVHPYLRRRNGIEKPTYPKDELKAVLERTLGVPLFQEQAMQIAITAARFSADEADQLRRAMATFRNTGTIQTFRDKFINGMTDNGYATDFAVRCFREIEGFGEYGFPESHAASFALLVYVSCWIKYHHPDVFACALLNSQPMGFYAPAQIVRDFRDHGGEAREVDINQSDWDCTLEPREDPVALSLPSPLAGEGGAKRRVRGRWLRTRSIRPLTHPPAAGALSREGRGQVPESTPQAQKRKPANALRLGFRQVGGLSDTDATAIVTARAAAPFTSLEDFAARTGLPVHKLKTLAEADVFRSIGLDRRQALWAVSRYAETGTPASLLAGLPLFAAADASPLGPEAVVKLPDMPLGEHVLADYIAIRMSLKAHPMALLRPEFDRRDYLQSARLRTLPSGPFVKVAGIVLIRQRPGTASGVIFSTLEDETGIANIIIWPKVFEEYRRIVLGARLLGVRGQLQSAEGVIHVIAREMFDMSGHLATLAERGPRPADFLSPVDEVHRPVEEDRRAPRPRGTRPSDVGVARRILPKGRNFH
jgi:error-prone DNA polymerase